MPLSKQAELAHARRVLKRMEEDLPRFSLRVQDLSPEERAMAMKHFNSAGIEQQERVRRLENPT